MAEQPDLHELAARTETLYEAVGDLIEAIDGAHNAALGEYDEDTEEAIEGTASGDDAGYFETARTHLGKARVAISSVQDIIATVQGYRDFAESGAVEADA